MKLISLKTIILIAVIILCVHLLAVLNNWYWTIRWIDVPVHLLGGFWLGLIFLYFVNPHLEIKKRKFLIQMILVVSFAVLIGLFWEFFEFLFDVFVAYGGHLPPAQQGLADTMKDLFDDLVGGLAAFVVNYFQSSKSIV